MSAVLVGLADGRRETALEIVHGEVAADASDHASVGVAHDWCDEIRGGACLAQPSGEGAAEIVWRAGLDAGAVARLTLI